MDLRELNKMTKRYPYPIPNIQDLLMKLKGFHWATTLDLNMGYYHIELCPASKKLCTIVLPWGKYEYQVLPMGLSNSPDIFQENMSKLFSDLEFVREYIDDLYITAFTGLSHLFLDPWKNIRYSSKHSCTQTRWISPRHGTNHSCYSSGGIC